MPTRYSGIEGVPGGRFCSDLLKHVLAEPNQPLFFSVATLDNPRATPGNECQSYYYHRPPPRRASNLDYRVIPSIGERISIFERANLKRLLYDAW